MKSKMILLLFLIVLFAGFILVRFFILDKQSVYGKLKVISSPPSSIFVNNVIVGKTPFENNYKVGEYLIKLIPEGEATQSASWQGKVKIFKNALTYVNRELGDSDMTSAGEIFTISKMDKKPSNPNYGEINVETEPSGAIVYLDNDEKGVAPLILGDVIKMDHELSVFMPGYFRRNQKIKVDAGYRVNASFKLAFDISQQKKEIDKKDNSKNAASASADTKKSYVLIKDTPTGWLRVREDASIDASESAKVNPGEKYDFLEEKSGWYKIKLKDDKAGWVSSEYTELKSD